MTERWARLLNKWAPELLENAEPNDDADDQVAVESVPTLTVFGSVREDVEAEQDAIAMPERLRHVPYWQRAGNSLLTDDREAAAAESLLSTGEWKLDRNGYVFSASQGDADLYDSHDRIRPSRVVRPPRVPRRDSTVAIGLAVGLTTVLYPSAWEAIDAGVHGREVRSGRLQHAVLVVPDSLGGGVMEVTDNGAVPATARRQARSKEWVRVPQSATGWVLYVDPFTCKPLILPAVASLAADVDGGVKYAPGEDARPTARIALTEDERLAILKTAAAKAA